ncbi:MAG: IclR family transcriptional regulator C-terminal domain-containing protein [Nocardioides sp.]|uniref:IclR family transcriptional regulator n=1 Tax=Nocardioides sp. TaxID=35761 RepID=UPI0039E64CE7
MKKRSQQDTAVAGRQEGRHEYFIQSLARGLAVLDAFSAHRPELAIKDIADVAGVSHPSALRIGYTLVEMGYLVRNPISKGYRLGPKIVSVGMATLNSLTLPELAEPYLIDLRNRTQETVKLAIHAGPTVVFVSRLPSLLHPPSGHYLGSSLPIHASSLGRAILAWLPVETADELIAQAADVRLTPHTPTKDEVRKRLTRIRRRGYETNDRGTTLENRAVSAPLLDATHTAVGAINISISAQRITVAELTKRIAPEVVATARAISSSLPLNLQGSGWTSHLVS